MRQFAKISFLFRTACAVFALMPVGGSAQTITAYDHGGMLTWDPAATDRVYVVEWTEAMGAPWKRSLQQTRYVEGQTNASVSVPVPRFFRVRAVPRPPPGMVLVDRGCYRMGDQNVLSGNDWERPAHTVCIDPFFIDRYEVSNEQLRQVLQWAYDEGRVGAGAGGVTNLEGTAQQLVRLQGPGLTNDLQFSGGIFSVEEGRENFPAVFVTWYGAQAYCNYRSDRAGLTRAINFTNWTCDFSAPGYRLPTEAEWEKAARGGRDGHLFPWPSLPTNRPAVVSDSIGGSNANYNASGDPYETNTVGTAPVAYYNGSQSPAGHDMANGFGLYDMAGNVWEWCWDYSDDFSTYYSVSPTNNPTGPASGFGRMIRGGSWNAAYPSPHPRTAMRWAGTPDETEDDYGFRCVKPAP